MDKEPRQNKLIEFALVILSAAKDLAGNSRRILRFAQNDRRRNWSFCFDTAPKGFPLPDVHANALHPANGQVVLNSMQNFVFLPCLA